MSIKLAKQLGNLLIWDQDGDLTVFGLNGFGNFV